MYERSSETESHRDIRVKYMKYTTHVEYKIIKGVSH